MSEFVEMLLRSKMRALAVLKTLKQTPPSNVTTISIEVIEEQILFYQAFDKLLAQRDLAQYKYEKYVRGNDEQSYFTILKANKELASILKGQVITREGAPNGSSKEKDDKEKGSEKNKEDDKV